MNGNCFEIGTIQAFLDGETAPELSLKVTNHVAACDNCALLLAEAEEESSLVFSVLDREYDTLVPTQRLWSRINDSIAVEKSRTSLWDRLHSAVFAFVSNPSIAVAAGILMVFGLFGAIWNFQSDVSSVTTSEIASSAIPGSNSGTEIVDVVGGDAGYGIEVPKNDLAVTESKLRPEKLRKLVTQASFSENRSRPTAQRAGIREAVLVEDLPGEATYVKTIATLRQNIDTQKDTVLRPSTRIAYERDMAVVNDAISKMKEVVRKNPKNQSAKQVLYSSYQNKIDLLNSVVERDELMASLK